MSFRGGRGRGRGRGGYGNAEYAKPEPFVFYPEIKLPDSKSIPIDEKLVQSYFNFNRFWINSPYHLGDGVSKKEKESLDIERFSDSLKPKIKSNKKGSFYDFLVLRPDNFPKELLGDTRRERPVKRAKWSQESNLLKLDVFEKLEAKHKVEGNKDKEEKEKEKEKDKEEGEDDDEEVGESESESYESNDDYEQNRDFDDDDDDYNQADDGDVEELY